MANISQPERKRLIIYLSIFSVFCLGFGFFYIRYNLRAPFEELAAGRTVSLEKTKLEKIAALKTMDTDGEGLVDYDELYQYNTSPYLADSDSDGYDDKTELDSGNDPNCLAGRVCEEARTDINGNINLNADQQEVAQLLAQGDQVTADQVRELLLKTGASQAMLDGLDNQTLMDLYQQTVQETGVEVGVEDTANLNVQDQYVDLLNTPQIDENTFTELTNLTVAEIRELLIASGVDGEVLNGVDDETLQAVYLEALAEQQFSTNTNQTITNTNN